MTPGTNTLFSVLLFLALFALMLLNSRRNRVSRLYRESLSSWLKQ
jgi:hypothetical protein